MVESTSSPFSSYSDIAIDYSNPIVKGLTDVFIPSRGAWVNLLDNTVYPDTSTGSFKATVFGNAYNYTDDDPDFRAVKDPLTASSLNEFTIVSIVNPANSTADHGLITVADDGGGTGWSILCWADTLTSELRVCVAVSDNGGTNIDIGSGAANTIIVGEINTIVASRKLSGEFRFSVNGDYSTTVADSIVPTVAGRETRVAARSSVDGMAFEGDAFAFFIFDRQLSQAESISLSNNPFQILKPTVDPITTALTAALTGAPPSGGGGNNPNDFICGIAGLTAIAVPDKWQEYLTGKGFPYGSFNDSQFEWLGTNGGYTGSLTDRTNTWRANGFPDL